MDGLHYVINDGDAFAKADLKSTPNIYGAGSIYHTFEAMKDVNRPEGEEIWHFFNPNHNMAWKTGTSYGNRDAWSIGVTHDTS
ncbi:multimodular transpeptidase-transglycosylase [Nonlabens ulvanivorans]|nr:multimodular transpeptidase-transglycosylase [Nonlabens ulvanivorans]